MAVAFGSEVKAMQASGGVPRGTFMLNFRFPAMPAGCFLTIHAYHIVPHLPPLHPLHPATPGLAPVYGAGRSPPPSCTGAHHCLCSAP